MSSTTLEQANELRESEAREDAANIERGKAELAAIALRDFAGTPNDTDARVLVALLEDLEMTNDDYVAMVKALESMADHQARVADAESLEGENAQRIPTSREAKEFKRVAELLADHYRRLSRTRDQDLQEAQTSKVKIEKLHHDFPTLFGDGVPKQVMDAASERTKDLDAKRKEKVDASLKELNDDHWRFRNVKKLHDSTLIKDLGLVDELPSEPEFVRQFRIRREAREREATSNSPTTKSPALAQPKGETPEGLPTL